MTKTIRIPDEDYEKVRQYADKRDIPMSAALSQYLNVVEDVRTQLHRDASDAGQSSGVSEVDDWEAPAAVEEQQDRQAPPHEEDLGTVLASLQDRIETLEADLEHLQETVQKLHTEEDSCEASTENQ